MLIIVPVVCPGDDGVCPGLITTHKSIIVAPRLVGQRQSFLIMFVIIAATGTFTKCGVISRDQGRYWCYDFCS